MAAVEQNRLQIEKWFNAVPYPMHKGMSDLYVTDPRFDHDERGRRPGARHTPAWGVISLPRQLCQSKS